MTIPAPPALLRACPGCQHNQVGKDKPLCRTCDGKLPPWLQEELLSAWDTYFIFYHVAALILRAPRQQATA